jgi:hypothetical protein
VLTAERLSAAYDVPIEVSEHIDGLRIRPRRSRRVAEPQTRAA